MDDMFKKGTIVHSRDNKIKGKLTGSSRVCRLEGCTGRALAVRWENGKLTYPCTKGMREYKGEWYIM